MVYFKPNDKEVGNNLKWLQGDEDSSFTTYVLPSDEDDEDDRSVDNDSRMLVPAVKKDSWELLNEPQTLPVVVNQLLALIHSGNKVILICDDTGDSTPATVYCLLALVRYQVRIEESLKWVEECRPSVQIALPCRKGLLGMQKVVDKKVLQRLNEKMRHSAMVSLGF